MFNKEKQTKILKIQTININPETKLQGTQRTPFRIAKSSRPRHVQREPVQTAALSENGKIRFSTLRL